MYHNLLSIFINLWNWKLIELINFHNVLEIMPIHSSVEGYILPLPFLLLFPLLWFAEEIKNCCDNSIFSLLFSEHGTRNGWWSQDVMEWSLVALTWHWWSCQADIIIGRFTSKEGNEEKDIPWAINLTLTLVDIKAFGPWDSSFTPSFRPELLRDSLGISLTPQ